LPHASRRRRNQRRPGRPRYRRGRGGRPRAAQGRRADTAAGELASARARWGYCRRRAGEEGGFSRRSPGSSRAGFVPLWV